MKILLILRKSSEQHDEYVKARGRLLEAFPSAVFTDEFDAVSTAFQLKTIVATETYFTGGIDPKVWIEINKADVAIDVAHTLSLPGNDGTTNLFKIAKTRGWVENGAYGPGKVLNHSGLYAFIGHCYGLWNYRLKYLGE